MNEEPTPLRDEADLAKWPRVIGVISLIYGCVGLLCMGASVTMTFLGPMFAKMGGMDMTIPPAIKVFAVVGAVCTLVLAVLMITGAISLMRYRRMGVSRLKIWAVLRLVLLTLTTIVGIMMMPIQLEMQETILDANNARIRESGRAADLVKPWDEDAAFRTIMITTGVTAGIAAVYPLFLGFFLSRRKVSDEVQSW